MKKTTLVFFSLLAYNLIHAQQNAVTETGEEIILYDDGTWIYQNPDQFTETEIATNLNTFVKNEKSSFLLKSSNLNVGFYINPKKWSFKKGVYNQDAEYELQLKKGDLYGMIISEKVEIPLETLRTIAVDNGKTLAPDLKIVKEEYRTVNGLKVLQLQMDGSMKGIKISYYGYYYSNSNGTVQFVTYTSQNLLDSYIPEIEILLNGIVKTI